MNQQPQPGHNDESDATHSDDAVIGRAFRRSIVGLIACGTVIGGIVYWSQRTPIDRRQTEHSPPLLPDRRQTGGVEIPEMPFTDITQESGIEFVHENGASGDKLLPETMGGGCAFLDIDNDNDQDILLVNSQRWPWDPQLDAAPATLALYENDGLGHFQDITPDANLDVSLYGMGVAVGDYDNDGYVDLFVSALGTNRLFHNQNGRFVDVTATAGVAGGPNEFSSSCGWFDYDNDGALDLMVCNYLKWSKESDLGQNFQLLGGGRAYGRPQDFEGTDPYLYHNNGDGTFTDVTALAGLQVRNPATDRPMSKALGLAFVDIDSNGLLDIVVANDTVQNFLFLNKGDGTFDEAGALTGVAFDITGNARGAMGIDVAHFRNSDAFGIAIGNFSNEMTALYVSQGSASPGVVPAFSDEAVSNGLGPVTRLELTFGIFFFDCDLDGRPDLFSANGHLEEDINKVQASQTYEQSPRLLWNAGSEQSTEFVTVPEAKTGRDFNEPMVGRGATFSDIDADGDLDVLIGATGQAPRLLRNDQELAHHWLRLKLVGTDSNRDAIGAHVEVHVADRVLRQQVMSTRSYLSQTETPLTFGLGHDSSTADVRIRWPSGKTTHIESLAGDRLHVINETAGLQ